MATWYRTGTVAVTNGNATIIGTGTLFTVNASSGDIFIGPDLAQYEITVVTDDTHINVKTLAGVAGYAGATLSNQNYAIIRNFTSTLTSQLAAQLTTLVTNWQTREDQFRTWNGGAVNGGPNFDGNYPLTDAVGVSQNIACPAKLQALAGLTTKIPVKCATTANITLSGTQTIDTIALLAGDRVLVKNQTTGSQNGIYVVNAAAWTMASDFDISSKAVSGCLIPVQQGGTLGMTIWQLTNTGTINLGTTVLTFAQVYPDPNKANLAGGTFTGPIIATSINDGVAANANVRNRFHPLNVGTAALTTGWQAAAFGDTTGDNVVIGQAGGQAIIGAHNSALSGWANLLINTAGGKVLMGTAIDAGTGLLQVNGNIACANMYSGVWTPTFAGLVNCSGITIDTAIYNRVGNHINYNIRLGLTVTTANTTTSFIISPPVASTALYTANGGIGICHLHTSTGTNLVVGYTTIGGGTINLGIIPLVSGASYIHIVGTYNIV